MHHGLPSTDFFTQLQSLTCGALDPAKDAQIPTYAQERGEWGLILIGAISSLPTSNFIIVDRERYNRIVY